MAMPVPPVSGGAPSPQSQSQGAQPQGGQSQGQGSQLVASIQSQMMQLLSLMQKAGLPKPDIQAFQGIISTFQNFIEKELSADQDDQSQNQPPSGDQGAVPMEVGKSKSAIPAY